MLGAYRRALGELADRPELVVPFLFPTLLLVGLRALVYTGGDLAARGDLVEGLAGVLVLYLGVSWYLAALGSTVRARSRDRLAMPEGPVYVASAIGAGLVAAPLAGFVLLVGLQGPQSLGAFSLMGSVLLLMGSLVAAGRAIGLPVEAAVGESWSLETLKRGNRRAREHGGLGLAFLAFLLLVPLVVVPPLLGFLVPAPWAGYAQLAIGFLGLVLVGAWAGLAVAIGLAGGGEGLVETFECPRCGGQARVEEGQASCECGLEGPYYAGSRA